MTAFAFGYAHVYTLRDIGLLSNFGHCQHSYYLKQCFTHRVVAQNGVNISVSVTCISERCPVVQVTSTYHCLWRQMRVMFLCRTCPPQA